MSENNPLITISYEGGMQFVAENSTGCKTPAEPAVSMGGSGQSPKSGRSTQLRLWVPA